MDIALSLEAANASQASDTVLIDGVQTIPADLLQIDYQRAEFDRHKFTEGPLGTDPRELIRSHVDPRLDGVLRTANSWLTRLRVVSRAGPYRAVDLETTYILISYLNDDGSDLTQAPDLYRRIGWTPRKWTTLAMDSRVWDAAASLGWEFKPLSAQLLLLDAFALLPDVGPALTLANIALEVRIAQVLDESVPSSGVGPALWSWINDRQRYWQNPSVNDQFDALLRALSSRSLRDEKQLWTGFKQLRQARNTFVHSGEARLGKNLGTPVTPAKAAHLLETAMKILGWLDQLWQLRTRTVSFDFPMEFTFNYPMARITVRTGQS